MSRTPARGQSLREYGLLLALVGIIVVTSLIFLGPIIEDHFYAPITVDGETYIAVKAADQIKIDGELFVAADTDTTCLVLSEDAINVNGSDYLAVAEGNSLEHQGRTFVLVDDECLEDNS